MRPGDLDFEGEVDLVDAEPSALAVEADAGAASPRPRRSESRSTDGKASVPLAMLLEMAASNSSACS
jgi:hypothetical protein